MSKPSEIPTTVRIPLFIQRTKEGECDGCPFLKGNYGHHSGSCSLFNETLEPVLDYGDVVGWRTCGQCNDLCNNHCAK